MYPAKKTLKNGKIIYYIRYRNENGKLVYFPKDRYVPFSSKTACREWIIKQRASFENIKKQAEIVRKIALKAKFPKFEKLIKHFENAQKEEAPNSYDSSIHYLENYVLKYFLDMRQLQDPNEWYLLFEDFRLYLEKEATLTGKSVKIQPSTRNKCIQTLNKFLAVMQRHQVVKNQSSIKCRPFKEKNRYTRGTEYLILEEEYEKLKLNLKEAKDFFIILYNTGMRFHELYSLPFNAIQSVDNLPLHLKKRFKEYKTKVYGYILLESQLDGKTRNEAKKNTNKKRRLKKDLHQKESIYLRKPLKSCYAIAVKNSRIIPIIDKMTWKIIKGHYNLAVENYNMEPERKNPNDYFLLENIELNKVRRDFAKKCGKKGMHACRHTYITNLVGRFKDQTLVRSATAHRSETAFSYYNHLYESLNESATLKASENTFSKIA